MVEIIFQRNTLNPKSYKQPEAKLSFSQNILSNDFVYLNKHRFLLSITLPEIKKNNNIVKTENVTKNLTPKLSILRLFFNTDFSDA